QARQDADCRHRDGLLQHRSLLHTWPALSLVPGNRQPHGCASLTRFSFTGVMSGAVSPSTVSLVTCHVMWSLSVFVTRLVAVTFLPAAGLAVTLSVHGLPSLFQPASPNPPPE